MEYDDIFFRFSKFQQEANMIKKLIVMAVVASFVALQGCSVSRVFNAPAPVDACRVKVGENRQIIVSILGPPKASFDKQDKRVEKYEFVDGYSDASKSRAVLYIAGDILTLCLAEVIFWPIELAAANGTKGFATVNYGMDDFATAVLITKENGQPWDCDSNK